MWPRRSRARVGLRRMRLVAPVRLEDGVEVRVPPLAAAPHVLAQEPLLLHADLLEDAGRGPVLDVARRPDSMEREALEAEGHEGVAGLGGEALAPDVAGEHVADVAVPACVAANLDPTSTDQALRRREDDGQVIRRPWG